MNRENKEEELYLELNITRDKKNNWSYILKCDFIYKSLILEKEFKNNDTLENIKSLTSKRLSYFIIETLYYRYGKEALYFDKSFSWSVVGRSINSFSLLLIQIDRTLYSLIKLGNTKTRIEVNTDFIKIINFPNIVFLANNDGRVKRKLDNIFNISDIENKNPEIFI